MSGERIGLRALKALLTMAGPEAQLVRHVERPWSSATFTGRKISVLLQFDGVDACDAGNAMIHCWPDQEWAISGALVADATIGMIDGRRGDNPRLLAEFELLLLDK